MNRKKKARQQKKKFSIHPFILFFILVLISIPLILSLVDWFSERQILKFSSPDRLLFVQSDPTVILLVGMPIAVILCFLFWLEDKKKKKTLFINKYIFIGLAIIVVGSLFVGNGFYSYAHFDQEGIKTRNGLFAKEMEHGWESAESVTTSYSIVYNRHSGKNISLHYDLHMAGGRVVNLYKSPDFFTHIVKIDRYLQQLGIPIHRSGINQEDYGEFIEHFKGPGKLIGIDRLEVVEEILMQRTD